MRAVLRPTFDSTLTRLLRLALAIACVTTIGARVLEAVQLCCDDIACVADCDSEDEAGDACPPACATCHCGHAGFAFPATSGRSPSELHPSAMGARPPAVVRAHALTGALSDVFHPPRPPAC